MTNNDEKPPRKKRIRKPPERKRMSEEQIVSMGSIFPGFAEWYRANHDEAGNPTFTIPGLRTPPEPQA